MDGGDQLKGLLWVMMFTFGNNGHSTARTRTGGRGQLNGVAWSHELCQRNRRSTRCSTNRYRLSNSQRVTGGVRSRRGQYHNFAFRHRILLLVGDDVGHIRMDTVSRNGGQIARTCWHKDKVLISQIEAKFTLLLLWRLLTGACYKNQSKRLN